MTQQRQVKRNQLLIIRNQSLVAGIDLHDAGDPLHQRSAIVLSPVESLECIFPVRIDARTRGQVVMLCRRSVNMPIGDVNLCSTLVELTIWADDTVQREYNRLLDLGRSSNVLAQCGDHDIIAVLDQLLETGCERLETKAELVAIAKLGRQRQRLSPNAMQPM